MKNVAALDLFSKKFKKEFSKDELLAFVTKRYKMVLDKIDDYQEAFNVLNDELGDNLLSKYFVYHVSDGGEWEVVVSTAMPDEMLNVLRANGWAFDSTDELESAITHKVIKTEGNVGCDCYSALSLELEDFPDGYDWGAYVQINIPDGEPCLSYVE